jgi:hypothetical protein
MSRKLTPKKNKEQKRSAKSKKTGQKSAQKNKSAVQPKLSSSTQQEIVQSKEAEVEAVSRYLERIQLAETENQQLQLQIQLLQADLDLRSQREKALQEQLIAEAAQQLLLDGRHPAEQQIQAFQTETQVLNSRLQTVEADNLALHQQLENEQRERQAYFESNQALEAKLQNGNLTIESILDQKENLEKKLDEQKHLIAIEWAQGLGDILTKLSALADKEPEPVLGLKPRAIYETLLSWLEQAFGARPRTFPSTKELTTTPEGKYIITLDADADGIEALLKRYDWSHERPFENRAESQRQCQFKVLHWGWKVNDVILVRAKVALYQPESNQV